MIQNRYKYRTRGNFPITNNYYQIKTTNALLKFFGIIFVLLSIGLVSNAYAHTSEIILGYKVEVGWVHEPPIKGVKNLIEIFITEATEFEKQLAEKNDPTQISVEENISEDEGRHDHSSHDHSSHDHGNDHDAFEEKDVDSEVEPEIEEHVPEIQLEGLLGQIQQIIFDEQTYRISEYKAVRLLNELFDQQNLNHTETTKNIETRVNKIDFITMTNSHEILSIREIIDAEVDKLVESQIEEPIPVTGLANKIEVDVTIGGTKSFLKLTEDQSFPGRYEAKFTPLATGIPLFNIFLGTLGDKEISIVLHPESVEERTFQEIFEEDHDLERIECANDKVLMIKNTGDGIGCVTPESADILENRGWDRF